eukprot:TRINITY_DN7825_c0_g1_i1.p1 TRINITY_DN7825_c0_g1~~TRINITY_DN7825_c0_g1_i1.p1  ORF type:complete len:599 (-),score=124.96 TRINITY_DN7825_c0_g1_i1:151-1875(-)
MSNTNSSELPTTNPEDKSLNPPQEEQANHEIPAKESNNIPENKQENSENVNANTTDNNNNTNTEDTKLEDKAKVSSSIDATKKPVPSSDSSAATATIISNRKDDLLGRRVISANGVSYSISERIFGNGSFGVVFQANVVGTGELVAIKKVLQDRRFKNRELQIMRLLNHPNIVLLKNSFYSNGERPDEVYLNLVLEYVPETVYKVARHYSRLRQPVPLIYVKLYIYQLSRSLAYIHSLGICHRDIKPQNLLIDPSTGVLKLCDFGSAKILIPNEPNVSYICSRYYRAPELIFGSTNYETHIDVWSMGCVMAELLLGQPLFPGESGVDQLVEIIKVLGTPTREQIQSMNQNYSDFRFPQIRGHSWTKVFRNKTPVEALDLINKLLQYSPSLRIKPMDACAHPFFEDLRNPATTLPNQRPLPTLFDFSVAELSAARHIHWAQLLPPQLQAQCSALRQQQSDSTTTSSSPPETQPQSSGEEGTKTTVTTEDAGSSSTQSSESQKETKKEEELPTPAPSENPASTQVEPSSSDSTANENSSVTEEGNIEGSAGDTKEENKVQDKASSEESPAADAQTN